MSVDYAAFDNLVAYQLKRGVSAVVVAGTTGEGATLTLNEKSRLLERALVAANKRIPVIAAAGSNDTAAAIKQCKRAQGVGAAALLVITAYYNKTSDNGLIAHFFAIADSVDIPIIVYNVPSRTGVDVSADVYKKLSAHPNICGVKEAGGNFSKIVASITKTGEKLKFYSGDDETFIPFLACGGDGLVSVAANVCPSPFVRAFAAMKRGDIEAAKSIQTSVNGLIRALFCQVNPIPVKYALSKMRLCKNTLRLPLVPLDKRLEKVVDRELERLGLI